MTDTIVADGKVVIMHYTLKDAEGETIDSSVGEQPMPYLHGKGNIVPGLEQALTGKQIGDKVSVVVAPEDGYGVADDEAFDWIPREVFPADIELEVGEQMYAQSEEGGVITFVIAEVQDDKIRADFNHPLAGKTLYFDVEIVGVRDANLEERLHGHPHGITGDEGHHHH